MLYIVPAPSTSLLQGTACYPMLQALRIRLYSPLMPQWHGTYTSKYTEVFTDANIKEDWDQKSVPMEIVNNHHLSI